MSEIKFSADGQFLNGRDYSLHAWLLSQYPVSAKLYRRRYIVGSRSYRFVIGGVNDGLNDGGTTDFTEVI